MSAKRTVFRNILFAFVMLAVLFSGVYRPAQAASESQTQVCKTYHTVVRGEYLSQIARQYNVSWRWLAEVNKITDPSKIFPGQKLCVELQPATTPVPTPVTTPVPGGVCKTYHTVARGEYLSMIAAKYGVSWRWLAEINKLADPSKIITGQKLCVEMSSEPVCTQYHTVARGEYLVLIARKYNTTWRWLAEINNLKDPTRLYAGNRLCVAMSGTPTAPPAGGLIPTITITGVVRDGTVTIQTKSFPANDTFVVMMDKMGTRAVNGIQVGTLNSGQGGALQAVFNIPESLKGQAEIAIRLESRTSGYYAYNWFTNATRP